MVFCWQLPVNSGLGSGHCLGVIYDCIYVVFVYFLWCHPWTGDKFSRERCHGPGFSTCIFVVLFHYLWGLFSDARAQSRTFGRGVRLHFDFCFAVGDIQIHRKDFTCGRLATPTASQISRYLYTLARASYSAML